MVNMSNRPQPHQEEKISAEGQSWVFNEQQGNQRPDCSCPKNNIIHRYSETVAYKVNWKWKQNIQRTEISLSCTCCFCNEEFRMKSFRSFICCLMNHTYSNILYQGLQPDTEYRVRVLASTSAGYSRIDNKDWPWVDYRTPVGTNPGNTIWFGCLPYFICLTKCSLYFTI